MYGIQAMVGKTETTNSHIIKKEKKQRKKGEKTCASGD